MLTRREFIGRTAAFSLAPILIVDRPPARPRFDIVDAGNKAMPPRHIYDAGNRVIPTDIIDANF